MEKSSQVLLVLLRMLSHCLNYLKKLEEYSGNLQRAAVELAKEWGEIKCLDRLEAMLIVMNKENMLLISGTGEVIEPDDGILAMGSGGNYALICGPCIKKIYLN